MACLTHPRDEGAPLVQNLAVVEHIVRVRLRRVRLAQQLHVRLAWRPARLAMIAAHTSANHVVPRVRPFPPARQDVVQRQLPGPLAAVLAGIAVSVEHRLARKSSPHYGTLHHIDQSDHRGSGEQIGHTSNVAAPILYEFGLPSPYQRQRASHVANVQRLVVLVQHQNGRIYGRRPAHVT